MEMKKCSKCGELKPLSEFQKDKSRKDGYCYRCKECVNSDKHKKAYAKEYRENHKEYFKEKHAEYRERNREKERERSKQYRLKNPEKTKEYYIKNRDRILKYNHEYTQSDHGKRVIKARRKTDKYKGLKTYSRMKRRNKYLSGDKTITLEKLYERDNGVCKICGGLCDYNDYEIINDTIIAGNNYPSIDHIVPINKGGSHTWDNVQLSHRLCNCRKKKIKRLNSLFFIFKKGGIK